MRNAQAQYQVRFDWGLEGSAAIGGGADAVIWVDQLGTPAETLPDAETLVAGTIQNSAAVAAWVLARQSDAGDRFTVAVVAAGEPGSQGGLRFAVEDLLAAGAIVDALADFGIDYCSPEAAAACAAFRSLRRGAAHLISASESGMTLGMPLLDLSPIDEVQVLRQR
jgi:2-phosphosulfolactate phosphatase